MPWNNNSGGSGGGGNPWGSGGGGGGGPWGGGNRPSGPGGRGPRPPDIEAILRRGQDRLKNLMPGGFRSGRGIAIATLVVVLIWLFTGLFRVQTNEQALKLIFGQYRSPPVFEGLNWNWPAPIGSVEIVKVNLTRLVEIGNPDSAARGRIEPRRSSNAQLMLTGDENIVDVRFAVFWQVRDPIAFRFAIRNPEDSIRAAAESAMREVIGKTEMLFAMTQGRRRVEEETKALLQQILDDYQSGVIITELTLQRVDPPTPQVNAAFVDVQAARADKESLINQANAYRNEILPRAKGEASRIVQEAEGYRAEIVNRAQGNAQRFLSVLTQYTQAKEITARRMMIETMEEVLRGTNKVLIDKAAMGGGVLPYLPLPEIKKLAPANPPTTTDQGGQK